MTNNVQYTTFVRSNPATNCLNTTYNTYICNANTTGYVQQGFMGQLNTRYSKIVNAYIEKCHAGKVELGVPVAIRCGDKAIIFCPIKAGKSDSPDLSAVKSCLEAIITNHKKWGVNGIATHKLGCGSNPDHYLDWAEVGPLMFSMLSQLDIPVSIYVAEKDVQYGVVPAPVVELPMSTPIGDRAVKPATLPVTPKAQKFQRKFYILHALTSQAMVVPEKDWGYIMAGVLELKVKAVMENKDVLDMVWDLCQNKENIAWHDRQNVQPGNSARSLSVGDIIIDDQNRKFFLVTGSGFKQVAMPCQFAKPVATVVEKKVDQDFILFSYLPNERVYENGEVRAFKCNESLTATERLHLIEEEFNLHAGDVIQMIASGNSYRLHYNGFKLLEPVKA